MRFEKLKLAQTPSWINDLPQFDTYNPQHLHTMTEWWQSLGSLQQFYYAIGIIALSFTLIQILLNLMGIGSDGFGGGVDFDLDLDFFSFLSLPK